MLKILILRIQCVAATAAVPRTGEIPNEARRVINPYLTFMAVLIAMTFASVVHAQAIEGLGFRSSKIYLSHDGKTLVADLGGPSYDFVLWKQGQELRYVHENAVVFGISGDGRMIIGYQGDDAFAWTEEGGLRRLPGQGARATGASYDGSIVVGWGCTDEWNVDLDNEMDECGVLMWSGIGAPIPLWFGRYRSAWTDRAGTVVVGVRDVDAATDGGHFYAWPSGNTAFTDVSSAILGLSADGKVAIGVASGLPASVLPGHRWEIGSEPEPIIGLLPQAINGDGSLIFGGGLVWTRDEGIRPLTEWLVENGVDIGEWQLTHVLGVSVDGRVLVGVGYNPEGTAEAWRVQLCKWADWEGAASGEFLSTDAWTNEVVPDSSRVARIRGDGTRTIDFPDDVTNGGLRVSGGGDVSFNLQDRTYTLEGSCGPAVVVDGSTLALVGGDETGAGKRACEEGGVTSNGITEVKGNVVSKLRVEKCRTYNQAGGHIRIDGEGGAEAWVEVLDGGQLTCGSVCAAGMRSDTKGRIEVRGFDSSWNDGQLWVGAEGAGTLEVSGAGARVRPDRLDAAFEPGGIATIRVNDAGVLDAADGIQLASGADSKATLTVDGFLSSAGVASGNVLVGGKGEATVTVEGEGSFYSGEGESSVGGQLRMGKDDGGSGRLSVSGAGSSVYGFSVVEVGSDGHGELNLTSNAKLERIGSLVLGAGSGRGTLSIKEGAEVSAYELRLAVGHGSAAAADVRGSGSLQAGLLLEIGIGGTGSLVVDDGVLEGLTAQLGSAPGGTGSLFVSSAGRANLRFLVVGQSGLGSVAVSSGGSIQSTIVTIPAGDGSGSVSVTGGGSLLESNVISLGLNGAGTLEAFDGGLIRTNTLRLHGNHEVSGNVRAAQIINGAPPANKAGAQENAVITDSLLVYGEGAVIEADTIIFGDGGVLGGTGPFSFPIVNVGTIAPADTTGPTGTLRLAAGYEQTASGDLEIEFAGPEDFDRLHVTGAAALGGTLRLRALDGYRPAKGERFEILSAESITGTFERVEGPDGIWVALTYTETTVEVEILTGVAIEENPVAPEELPRTYALEQNFPNPFNPSTEIVFALPVEGPARLLLYDLLGKELAVLIDGPAPAGTHRVTFDATGLPSGVYLYRLEAGTFDQTRRMVLTK